MDILTAPGGSIVSPGPLTKITTSPLLNCDVRHAGDNSGEWYGNTACGTFVAVDTAIFGPASVPAGSGVTGATGYQAYTAVSQNGPTGTGSAGSPYVLTTVVDLGTTGLRLTQTDSYVVGQESYRTDVSLTSTDNAAHTVIVYRAGDCYLQDSDEGLGQVFSRQCAELQGRAHLHRPEPHRGVLPADRRQPLHGVGVLPGVERRRHQDAAARHLPLRRAHRQRHRLSWPAAVAATGSTTIASLTVFSPVGGTPVSLTKTADDSEVEASTADGYTVTISNPGAVAQTLTSITDTLPAGFSYVAGSSTGVTTANPNVSGQTLTWSGSFSVPAATGGTPGTSDPPLRRARLRDAGHLHQLGLGGRQRRDRHRRQRGRPDHGDTGDGRHDAAGHHHHGRTVGTRPTTTRRRSRSPRPRRARRSSAGSTRRRSRPAPRRSRPAALSDGAHTFEVRATDAAGNTDTSPASRSFTVDTTPPDTTITAGPAGTHQRQHADVLLHATEAGSTFQCRVDAAAFASCSSPFTTAALSDGAHTFEVRATDAAGNTDAVAGEPGVHGRHDPAGHHDHGRTVGPDQRQHADVLLHLRGRVDLRVPGRRGGVRVLHLAVHDGGAVGRGAHVRGARHGRAGNTDASPASRAFTVDTTPPDTTITAGPSGTTSDSTPTFSFTATEAGSTFECRVDAAAFASCSSPFTTAHCPTVRTSSRSAPPTAVGLTDPTPASRSFTVDTSDTTAPDTTITAGPSGTTGDSTPTFSFTSEAGATFECRVDGGAWSACSSPFTTAALADGPHTFEVRATDGHGNTDPTPASRGVHGRHDTSGHHDHLRSRRVEHRHDADLRLRRHR